MTVQHSAVQYAAVQKMLPVRTARIRRAGLVSESWIPIYRIKEKRIYGKSSGR